MRYFVAHLLPGSIDQYYEILSHELSKRYRIEALYKKVPAHVTLKPPFETDEAGIRAVERVIRTFVLSEKPIAVHISRFGRFGFKTIYLDIETSELQTSMRRAIDFLDRHLPWLPSSHHHGGKPHISVARFLDRVTSRRIWRQLRSVSVSLTAVVDTIAILQKKEERWVLYALIPLGGSDSGFQFTDAIRETSTIKH